MKSSEIRRRFLEYFAQRGHTKVPSSGLIPVGDPTLLFTNAGMVQFKGVFLGEDKREYTRAASCQKCVRAGGKHNDLENVGKTARHHTFFEMLGNFSFGDYFKEEAIGFAWEFLTSEMGLPAEHLYATVYEKDDEAEAIWTGKIGLAPDRVKRMGEKDNFWSMGEVGPCGPCSEIIIDQGVGVGCGSEGCAVGCDCDRFLEIWNLVFMQYNRDKDGSTQALPKPSIDTGMGLERLAAVMQGKHSNYETDLFIPLIDAVEKIAGVRYGASIETDTSIKAIVDHARAIAFLITDGVLPSNEGRGYVLRRIIRRAVRHGRFLGLAEPFLHKVSDTVIALMEEPYPELARSRELVAEASRGEEERFFETLERGLAMLDDEVAALKKEGGKVLPGVTAFRLYDTYGFPLDLTADIIKSDAITVDEEGFNKEMELQRTRARKAWKGSEETATEPLYGKLVAEGIGSEFVGYDNDRCSSEVICIIKDNDIVESASGGDEVELITSKTPFYGESGGQVGDSGSISGTGAGALSVEVLGTKRPAGELIVHQCRIKKGTLNSGDTVELVPDAARRAAIRRSHTATHILHALLRESLGEHVRQAGSLVSPEGFRFDFNHYSAVDEKTLKRIEARANEIVMSNLEVVTEVLAYDEAIDKGALAFFGEKYTEMVRLVSVTGVSKELCGGTHAARSGDIGLVRITSESSVASGVRRIEALTGTSAVEWTSLGDRTLADSARILKSTRDEVPVKITKMLDRIKELEKEVQGLRGSRAAAGADELLSSVREVNKIKVLSVEVDSAGPGELRGLADKLRARIGSGVIVLGSRGKTKASLLIAITKDLSSRLNASSLIGLLAPVMGATGGGRADMAQAGGGDNAKLAEALEMAYEVIEKQTKEKP